MHNTLRDLGYREVERAGTSNNFSEVVKGYELKRKNGEIESFATIPETEVVASTLSMNLPGNYLIYTKNVK